MWWNNYFHFQMIDLINILSNINFQYYRSLLSNQSQKVYDKLYYKMLRCEKIIAIPFIVEDEIKKIFKFVLLDNPVIFYVRSATYQIVNQKYCNAVLPNYRFNKVEIDATINAIAKKHSGFIRTNRSMSDLLKEECVHNYLIETIVYDENYKSSSFECVGPLLFGRGVCSGISKATKMLLNLLGMNSLIITGKSHQNLSGDESHAWNLILLDGLYYHLDVTFDLTLTQGKIVRFDYFNLSDAEILEDHEFQPKSLPFCRASRSYYVVNHFTMLSPADLYKFLNMQLTSDRKDIVFKLPYTTNFERTQEKVCQITEDCLKTNCKHPARYQISINETQRVFYLHIEYGL